MEMDDCIEIVEHDVDVKTEEKAVVELGSSDESDDGEDPAPKGNCFDWNQCRYRCFPCDLEFKCRPLLHWKCVHDKSSKWKWLMTRHVLHSCLLCRKKVKFEHSKVRIHLATCHGLSVAAYEQKNFEELKTIFDHLRVVNAVGIRNKRDEKKIKFDWDQCRYRCFSCSLDFKSHQESLFHWKSTHHGGPLQPCKMTKQSAHSCLMCQEVFNLELKIISDHLQLSHQTPLSAYEKRYKSTLVKLFGDLEDISREVKVVGMVNVNCTTMEMSEVVKNVKVTFNNDYLDMEEADEEEEEEESGTRFDWDQCRYRCFSCSLDLKSHQESVHHWQSTHNGGPLRPCRITKKLTHSCLMCQEEMNFELKTISDHLLLAHKTILNAYERQFSSELLKIFDDISDEVQVIGMANGSRNASTESEIPFKKKKLTSDDDNRRSQLEAKQFSKSPQTSGAIGTPSQKSLIAENDSSNMNLFILPDVESAGENMTEDLTTSGLTCDVLSTPEQPEQDKNNREELSFNWNRCLYECEACNKQCNTLNEIVCHTAKTHKTVTKCRILHLENHKCLICGEEIRFDINWIRTHLTKTKNHRMTLKEYEVKFQDELRKMFSMSLDCPDPQDAGDKPSRSSTLMVHLDGDKIVGCEDLGAEENTEITIEVDEKPKDSLVFNQGLTMVHNWNHCIHECQACIEKFQVFLRGEARLNGKIFLRLGHLKCLVCGKKADRDISLIQFHLANAPQNPVIPHDTQTKFHDSHHEMFTKRFSAQNQDSGSVNLVPIYANGMVEYGDLSWLCTNNDKSKKSSEPNSVTRDPASSTKRVSIARKSIFDWNRCSYKCRTCSKVFFKPNQTESISTHAIKSYHNPKSLLKGIHPHHTCLICGGHPQFYSTAVDGHLKVKHQMTLQEYEESFHDQLQEIFHDKFKDTLKANTSSSTTVQDKEPEVEIIDVINSQVTVCVPESPSVANQWAPNVANVEEIEEYVLDIEQSEENNIDEDPLAI